MVEAMVSRFKEELGADTKIIATGGMANLVHKETDIFDYVNLDLTLVGLKIIYEINNGGDMVSGGGNDG